MLFECSWLRELDGADADGVQETYDPPYHDFNGITSRAGAHFILRVDRILMKERYHSAIINGVSRAGFPSVPVDYGYRDNTRFWYTQSRRPRSEPIPNAKEVDVSVVQFAADRVDDTVTFTEAACACRAKQHRVFRSYSSAPGVHQRAGHRARGTVGAMTRPALLPRLTPTRALEPRGYPLHPPARRRTEETA